MDIDIDQLNTAHPDAAQVNSAEVRFA